MTWRSISASPYDVDVIYMSEGHSYAFPQSFCGEYSITTDKGGAFKSNAMFQPVERVYAKLLTHDFRGRVARYRLPRHPTHSKPSSLKSNGIL